jgi:hypothetical protein
MQLDGYQRNKGPERKLRAFGSTKQRDNDGHAPLLRTNFLLVRQGERDDRGRAGMRAMHGDIRRL